MNRALYDTIARTSSPASEDTSAIKHALTLAQDSFVNAIADASVRRFDEAVADIVTTYGDLRSPRDLSAMMESAIRRMDLDDRLSMTDNRASGINAAPLLAKMPVPLVAFVAEAFKQMDRTIDINTHGNTLQMFIGQADGTHVKGGVTLDALQLTPITDSTMAALKALGVGIELNVGVEHARHSNGGAGVTLRLENDDAEALRRQFGAVINDLAQSSMMVGEGKAYEDVLSLLMDRHDDLSVSNSKTEDKAHMGKTFAHAGVKLDTMAHLGIPVPEGLPVPGQLSLSAEATAHNKRAKNSRTDQTGILQVSEFTIQAKHNIDGTLTAMSSPLTKGLYKSGGSHTLSVISKDGAVLPGSTRTTQHFSSHKAFEKAIKAEQQSWTQALVDSDATVGRSDADKLAAAETRLAQLLDDSKAFDTVSASGRGRLEGDFQLIRELKPDAAKVWNDLEAKAQLAADNGDESTAGALRGRIGDLANDPRNWMPVDLLSGKQFTSEGGYAVPVLEVRKAGGAGLATHMESSLFNPSWIRA